MKKILAIIAATIAGLAIAGANVAPAFADQVSPPRSGGSCGNNQTMGTTTLVSSTNTLQAGYTETAQTGEPSSLNKMHYSNQGYKPAFVTAPVTPPWFNPAPGTDFAGATWISTDSSWPGGTGNLEGLPTNDQWRLFKQKFDLPENATNVSGTLYFTGDNAVDVVLNGHNLTTTNTSTDDVYGSVPASLPHNFSNEFTKTFTPKAGHNSLKFVVRNWGGNFHPNPTGLLYKAVVTYCAPTHKDHNGDKDDKGKNGDDDNGDSSHNDR